VVLRIFKMIATISGFWQP